jgi:hypothetical protein
VSSNPKELAGVHLVEEFTRSLIRISVSLMKMDRREFDDAAEAQKRSLAEGWTGTTGPVLNHPVLPSQFELLASTSTARAREWQFAPRFAPRSPVPFDKAWKCFHSSHAIKVR